MRKMVTRKKLEKFMERLAANARGPGSVYFTGGATMLLLDIREQTVDIDLKFEPEPPGVFEAIAKLKNELDLNIELAAPDDFIPVGSEWVANSQLVKELRGVKFFHFDIAAQAIAKIQRGFEKDLEDVRALLKSGFVSLEKIRLAAALKDDDLIRYPNLDPKLYRSKILRFLDKVADES